MLVLFYLFFFFFSDQFVLSVFIVRELFGHSLHFLYSRKWKLMNDGRRDSLKI